MKTICTLLLGLSVLFSQCLAEDADVKDLKKKTVQGFVVPYVLRYDTDQWSHSSKNGRNKLRACSRPLEVIIRANNEEKNLVEDEMKKGFQEVIGERFANKNLYAGYAINPSKTVTINGVNFLHQSAIIHLAPNSVHHQSTGMGGYIRRYISENGRDDQLDYYVYSGDNGRISFLVESSGTIDQEDQALIDELFRGFSFDGSACQGPAKLRSIKTMFETVTDILK